jgi:hypothetical protein
MEVGTMITKTELCNKIQDVYPEAGVCGVDFDVDYDHSANAWVVDLHQGSHHLKTFIETDDASNCLEGKKCLPLGLKIAQLKYNFGLAKYNDQ